MNPQLSEHSAPVTAVIVTFNSGDVIAESLCALADCDSVGRTIVVDNASTDATATIVAEQFPHVELIQNTDNVGFGPANNQGLQLIESEFGFVLNPDAIVSEKSLLALIAVAQAHANAAIIGPILRESADTTADSGIQMRTGSVWDPQKTRIPLETDLEVEFIVGAAMFLRMSLVRQSGFFDPDIFLFYEDDDICRAARRAGYSLLLTSKAVVTHLVGKSTPPSREIRAFKQCHFTWSRLYIEQKEKGQLAARQLAMAQQEQLRRKLRFAQLTWNTSKQHLLKARQTAVECFLNGTLPSTQPGAFAETALSANQTKGVCQMELTACDLCEHQQFEQIADTDRHGKPLSTVICQRCGLVRHATVPTEEELQQFYSTDYRKEYNGEARPGNRRIMRAWVNGERICRQVGPLLESGSRVLEVGAGIGCTVKVFENAGFAAEGIDPGGEFLKYSRDNLHTNVQIRNLYELPQDQQYDAVLLVHVIEHLRSPKQALQHIAGLVKPGGMFYVECPNLQAPFARRSKLFHTAHIHNYVPSTLKMLAESCGFRLRKRFGDDQDVNLQMLFQHSGETTLKIDADNHDRTLVDLGRSNPLPYHLRARYVTDRIRKLGSYTKEILEARSFVEDLIRECQSKSDQHSTQAEKKAA